MDNHRFAHLENRIQALVAGDFARLFAGRLQPREVALRLAREMETHADLDDGGLLVAPNHYVLHLHPDDHAALLAERPDLAAALARHVIALAAASDLHLDADLDVVLLPDSAVGPQGVVVTVRHVEGARRTIQIGEVRVAEAGSPGALPNAFLIVDGERRIPLDRMAITIGRQFDSDIVIDDRRVSRQHCQLRLREGQFMLHDLSSRGGTLVNGTRVREATLQSGDVIVLAGVEVVYVVDKTTAPRRDTSADQPSTPVHGVG